MLSDILVNLTNEIFVIKFIKRTTGEIRTMRAMKGVKKYVSGKGASYDAASKGLVTVWDFDKMKELMDGGLSKEEAGPKSYRSIPLELILEISVNGETHVIQSPVLKTFQFRWAGNQVEVAALTEEAALAKLKLDCGMARKPRSLEVEIVKEVPYQP